MSAVDDLITTLENHLNVIYKMDTDLVDENDPRRQEWEISAGIIMMGIPFWVDLMSPDQVDKVRTIIEDFGVDNPYVKDDN